MEDKIYNKLTEKERKLINNIEWILGRKDVNIPEKDKKFIPKK